MRSSTSDADAAWNDIEILKTLEITRNCAGIGVSDYP
jgi:hypothetical protein